jgi:hypothetical protein
MPGMFRAIFLYPEEGDTADFILTGCDWHHNMRFTDQSVEISHGLCENFFFHHHFTLEVKFPLVPEGAVRQMMFTRSGTYR